MLHIHKNIRIYIKAQANIFDYLEGKYLNNYKIQNIYFKESMNIHYHVLSRYKYINDLNITIT